MKETLVEKVRQELNTWERTEIIGYLIEKLSYQQLLKLIEDTQWNKDQE